MAEPIYLAKLIREIRDYEQTDEDRAAQASILDLIARGYLVGIEVFGTEDCCEHGIHAECENAGFGLCDMFGPHSVGSDCNRAEKVAMRPSDNLDFERHPRHSRRSRCRSGRRLLSRSGGHVRRRRRSPLLIRRAAPHHQHDHHHNLEHPPHRRRTGVNG